MIFCELCDDCAKLPSKGSDESAGWDLYSNIDTTIEANLKIHIVSTGIKIQLPKGTYGSIRPRSGIAFKNVTTDAGVIDRDYTGEVKVMLRNFGDMPFHVKKGDRIAQLIIECICDCDIEQVNTLEETTRGTSGFGSTGGYS